LLRNPFYFDFPRQLLHIPLPASPTPDTHLLLLDSRDPDTALPLQRTGDRLAFFDSLPGRSEHALALYQAQEASMPAAAPAPAGMIAHGPATDVVIDTGVARFRLPGAQASDDAPPLLAVQGADGVWRGQGRLILPESQSVRARTTEILEDGPLLARLRVAYQLSGGAEISFTFTAHRAEAYLLVHESSTELDGARFEFSLREFGGGKGRGYLHWKRHERTADWSTLAANDRELARLQESVPWWIPPAGFGYAMTPDGLDEQDFIGVFTIRRGEWIDRQFEQISQGPSDEPSWRRELDWPYPEMVGSTLSMITAHSNSSGDAFFRFPLFDGQRHWGILVSTLECNDGPMKELSAVQHKNSSPTLQQWMTWHLDEPDTVQRPHVVARRQDLPRLRRKRHAPLFARRWQRIGSGQLRHGAVDGLRFAVEGDPLVAWRKKVELVGVAHVRARMTLLGRDYSDMYSPVGARPITQWAEEYDLIAASGVFTEAEERLVRAFLILMGHLYMSPDLMNWKYGSRNANFEADRVDVVGTIGVVFQGHPDSATFTRHAIELMERSLNTYCTPGSGKWYENPACYYLQASKCRMNLLFHLANAGLFDPTSLPRLKDYLRWGILLLTPPCPHDYDVMRDGCDKAAYRAAEKVRRIAPVGDHAHLGPWVPEHYALAARLYRASDPQFADELLWAYQSSGADGGYFGNLPLLFARLEEADLAPAPAQQLASRRLQGFGAVFRGQFGREDEFFLLFKQGPGGYRYHRTEGSIILFADGKPLIYDGGEAGEAWRHTTLSFYDVHMPLSAGHVERFYSSEALDFCQGVHPLALKPGQPVFLSDICSHDLVPEAIRRYQEPNPADSRSLWWVKDQYIVLHDELNIDPAVPSYWHMQVVADSHTGDWQEGYRFRGRFGTDLQVLLPGQSFVNESITQQPMLEYKRTAEQTFSMRHLALRAEAPTHYLAVLRPLGGDKRPVEASGIAHEGRTVGVRVRAEGIDDVLLLARGGVSLTEQGVRFEGRYGAVLQHGAATTMILLDGSRLAVGGIEIQASGVRVQLRLEGAKGILVVEGSGSCEVSGLGAPIKLAVRGERREMQVSGH
jgi:hypothetical protein